MSRTQREQRTKERYKGEQGERMDREREFKKIISFPSEIITVLSSFQSTSCTLLYRASQIKLMSRSGRDHYPGSSFLLDHLRLREDARCPRSQNQLRSRMSLHGVSDSRMHLVQATKKLHILRLIQCNCWNNYLPGG